MTEPEEHAGWQMHTGFAGNTDVTASTTSGKDRSMTEPEEHAGWQMHTGFASNTDATASAAASRSARAGVGTGTTTALCFWWGA
jgi:hypothetical protein